MKRLHWQLYLGLSLVTISAFLYFIHYEIFQDAHHIFIFLIGDIAFVPIEVLFVTLIIHRLLSEREKRAVMKKLNMVIGAFFSEMGIKLLQYFSHFDRTFDKIRENLVVTNTWSEKEFFDTGKGVKSFDCRMDSQNGNLAELRNFLVEKRDFLLRLLENPNLLEHESFTELLWAVSHLTEELIARADVSTLSNADYAHLSGDIKRAYLALIFEWLEYMRHLKDDYPYLFSFAVRMNPFDPNATPEIK
ncbi:MAG: hypothetical protein L3J18_09965 [Candidatus Brocadia sp.]|uniref:Uncharacterized protein n=1 Tax=Candidatus Brocadia fulgida TaxID=380242 RepID=A0A0M2V039_9BACT|nr:MAG: hypothetical protein BROFUL_01184 [Candidatus Brocadia fulgida]UJS19246.1 MAG: hypothetical protein L3J18_09965 [Candidatus Brocadia sp.]